MNQYRFILFNSVFDEVVDGFGGGVLGIENNLVFQVEPLEREVHDAPAFEVVLHLLAGAVDDVGDFVGHHEFLVLHQTTIIIK